MTPEDQKKVIDNLNGCQEDLEKTADVLKELEQRQQDRKDGQATLTPIVVKLGN